MGINFGLISKLLNLHIERINILQDKSFRIFSATKALHNHYSWQKKRIKIVSDKLLPPAYRQTKPINIETFGAHNEKSNLFKEPRNFPLTYTHIYRLAALWSRTAGVTSALQPSGHTSTRAKRSLLLLLFFCCLCPLCSPITVWVTNSRRSYREIEMRHVSRIGKVVQRTYRLQLKWQFKF